MNQGTILLVEDDEVLAGIVRRILVGQGYDVRLAATAAQARKLAQEPLHIALLDLCLPDGDGVELGHELSNGNPALRTILMTAYPIRLGESERLRGFARILTKPLDLAELRGTVAGILNFQEPKARPCEQALMVSS